MLDLDGSVVLEPMRQPDLFGADVDRPAGVFGMCAWAGGFLFDGSQRVAWLDRDGRVEARASWPTTHIGFHTCDRRGQALRFSAHGPDGFVVTTLSAHLDGRL